MPHFSQSISAFLAQGAPPAAPPASAPAVGTFDTIFWLTVLLIFLTAIVSAVVRLRLRDKCLRLFDDYHVTYLTTTGQTLWGDLDVFSLGLELRFDAPYTTRRGLVKNSALIYQPELANCRAICRVVSGLTAAERDTRRAQIERGFNPNRFRRGWRWTYNLFNTIRDAFSKSFSALIGQIAKANPSSLVLNSQRGNVDQLGQTLISAVPNAYEPMLEKHIGRPVIMELANPADPAKRPLEFPGYLAEYSDRFVSVFNVEHTPLESFELRVTEPLARPGVKVAVEDTQITLTCDGPDALLVKGFTAGELRGDLEVVLLNGASVPLPRPAGQPVDVRLERTLRLDLTCPRTQANIRFGGEPLRPRRENWFGVAPEHEIESRQTDFLEDRINRLLDWTGRIRAPLRRLGEHPESNDDPPKEPRS